MSHEIDILLKNAHVVDPVNHINEVKDIAVAGRKVVEVSNSISSNLAKDVHNLEGYVAVPGIIDSHVHASSLTGGKYAHKMLAAAGVTTALEMTRRPGRSCATCIVIQETLIPSLCTFSTNVPVSSSERPG